MADRSILYRDLWQIYRNSDTYKSQIEHWMNLPKNLPIMSWQLQLEVMDGAPDHIVKANANLLDRRAKKALGMDVKETKELKDWSYKALC